MRFNGCLKEKINVIRPLENFLNDFEKSFNTFWTKSFGKSWKIFHKISFQIFPQNFFDEKFLLQMPLKNFEALSWYVLSMKNVLQDQSYLMHVKSNLYDKFKEIYSQKREAVVKCHAFVAPLTIFGAICNGFY